MTYLAGSTVNLHQLQGPLQLLTDQRSDLAGIIPEWRLRPQLLRLGWGFQRRSLAYHVVVKTTTGFQS